MKEGSAEEATERDKLFGLFRFTSTVTDGDVQDQSLADYVGRMQPDQEEIYYLIAESLAAARTSPHLEALRAKNVEVLLLTDRIDPWMVQYLNEFDGKPLRDVTRGEFDLDTDEDESDEKEADDAAHTELLKRCKEILGEDVEEVRASRRLTDSAACLAIAKDDPGPQIRQLMEAAGQPMPELKPSLELNLKHPLLERLAATSDDGFADLVHLIYGQAVLAEGRPLPDPGAFVRRLNQALLS